MKNKYSITDKLTDSQFNQLHELSLKMWWSANRTKEEMATLIKHCMKFAVIDHDTQKLVGFARVLTDELDFAYIYDVMTEEHLRGNGLGKMLIESILTNPILKRVKYIELTCAPNMVEYYKKFGFTEDYGNVVAMRLNNLQSQLSVTGSHLP